MKIDITKMVKEIVMQEVMQARETQEEFIIETIYPYCENICRLKSTKKNLNKFF